MRGLDRIALVIAILAIAPGLYGGIMYGKERFTKETQESQALRQAFWRAHPELQPLSKDKKYHEVKSSYAADVYFEDERTPIPEYTTSIWKVILSGFFAAEIFFVVTLFGLRGLTRGVKLFLLWFFPWIIEGFVNKDNGD